MKVRDNFVVLIEEIIRARGHPNITGRHRTTLEVTKEAKISIRADCIIGIMADKAARHLSPELKRHLKEGGQIEVLISVENANFSFKAEGSPKLRLSSPKEIVFRRSDYIDDRTVAIRATAAARDIPRSMIDMLKEGRLILIMIRTI